MLPSLAVAAVLGIGGVGAGAALGGGGHHSTPLPRTVPTLVVTSSPTPTPAVSTPAAPAPAAAVQPDFAVTVVGRVSWVGVVGPHGRVLYAGLLRHGRTLTYRQRPLTVTLGDAGAVRLVLRHRTHAHAGRPGQVLRFTVR